MTLVKQKLTGGKDYMQYTRDRGWIYGRDNMGNIGVIWGRGMYLLIICNFIEREGNTSWKEIYYINPADIKEISKQEQG